MRRRASSPRWILLHDVGRPPATSSVQQLEQYLSKLWGDDVTVRDLSRIPGGASRETYRFDAEMRGK